MKTYQHLGAILLALLCSGCGLSGQPGMPEHPSESPMAFAMTNAVGGNTVMAYLRSSDGTLVNVASEQTGGSGVGHGLENQGALAVSQDGRFLYVVNPGSDDVSVFRIRGESLQLIDRAPSGGTLPVSVAEWNGIVYVLNRNESADPNSGPTIQGFELSPAGVLSAIPGSRITLRATNTTAAQIAISPDGRWIVVTERGADEIDLVQLSEDHRPGTVKRMPSAGHGPFGFAVSNTLRLYIAESSAGTASAYDINSGGTLSVLSAALPTQQRATCWLTISPDEKWVYVTNTASRSISSYRVAQDGSLLLVASVATTTSAPPLDATVDATGSHLNVLETDGSIETFLVDKASGLLSSQQIVPGLPSGANGLTGN